MKIVDLKNCKQIPKKYHYLIDWEATYWGGIEKDDMGYWLYLKYDLGEKDSMHMLHEPLKDMVYYLREAHEQVQTTGKYYLNY